MSESKHTPGPWTCKFSSGAGLAIWADASKALGERYSKDCPVYHVNPDAPQVQLAYELWTQFPREAWDQMQQANGMVMAAAPELLEALQSVIDFIEGKPDAPEPFGLVRAAIAKATGETP